MLDIPDTIMVREFVASLPPPERELAWLLMAGHTTRTAAGALGISARAARARLVRIRRRFRHAA